jgi:hypothetical protein
MTTQAITTGSRLDSCSPNAEQIMTERMRLRLKDFSDYKPRNGYRPSMLSRHVSVVTRKVLPMRLQAQIPELIIVAICSVAIVAICWVCK